ncbi:MAG: DUF1501 domain-containing protein [Acidobacteria bacterium]|nr:DUF1501 domain-containing protein [Acidobacteriota bacterium]MBI3425600.1 DUF1501 domain-containing protein [Acidobacteriota bacterium]
MQHNARNIPTLTRRELLSVGGVSLIGGYLNAFRPINVRAAQKAQPRATARQVLFLNLDGGMSQVDTLDAKEGPWTPNYFDIRSFPNDLKLPVGLMPNLPSVLDKLTIVRSMAAWDVVHGRAQYYIQTGHPLNLALSKEVPAIGAVVCYELAKQRKATDSLPAYVAMNLAGNQAGLINQGFMSAEFGPMSLAVGDAPPNLAPQKGMEETFKRRWERLQQLDQSLRGGGAADRSYADYQDYYRGAWAIMNDPRVPEVMALDGADKKRYGNSSIGNCLILARNLFKADAGTRFIMASHGGWDHHANIYKEGARNHPALIKELDAAFSSFLKDMDAIPSPDTPGKTLLDETLVIAMSEFGRTPGSISETRKGREHYMQAHCGMFVGGGVRRGAVIGKTDAAGGQIVEAGWSGQRPIYMEDIACTIYSALGIDWTKRIDNTPSGRAFHYVEPASGTKYVGFKPVTDLFA